MSTKGRIYIVAVVSAVILVTVVMNAIIFSYGKFSPLEGKNIILDPGHGGIDGGTNDNVEFFEKDINLQIATKLQEVLQSHKASVSLTRNSDISLDGDIIPSPGRHQKDLSARVAQFNSGKYDLYVSIHVNSSSNSQSIGPIVYYSPKFPENAYLAECLQQSLNAHMKSNLGVQVQHIPVKAGFFILKYADIPGLIVETGFISNAREKKLLRDDAYQQKLVLSICEGINEYFKNIDRLDKSKYEDNTPGSSYPEEEEDSQPLNISSDARVAKR